MGDVVSAAAHRDGARGSSASRSARDGGSGRLPAHVEDALNRLIVAFLLPLASDPGTPEDEAASSSPVSATASFLSTFRHHLHAHLTALTHLVARSSTALSATTHPGARDWVRAMGYSPTLKAPYGLRYGDVHYYLRVRPRFDRRVLAAALGTGTGVDGPQEGEVAPLASHGTAGGRVGSALGRSFAARRAHWGPSTEEWLDSDTEGDEHDGRGPDRSGGKTGSQHWELYPSFSSSSSSRNQVRPVSHSGMLFKPPKQPAPLFPGAAANGDAAQDSRAGSSLLHGHHEHEAELADQLADLLDADAPAPSLGTLPNPRPPPLPTQVDAHGMLTKSALSYMRALQGVVPAHLPALPPRHTWRRTPFYTSSTMTALGHARDAPDRSSSSSNATSGPARGRPQSAQHAQGSTTTTHMHLVDRKLYAARLAQNSLRRLISATEEASARAAELAEEEAVERARREGGKEEVVVLVGDGEAGSGVGAGAGAGIGPARTKMVPARLTPPASPPGPLARSTEGGGLAGGNGDDDDVVMLGADGKPVRATSDKDNGKAKEEPSAAASLPSAEPPKKRRRPRPPGWGDLVLHPSGAMSPAAGPAAAALSVQSGGSVRPHPGMLHFTQRATVPTPLRVGSSSVMAPAAAVAASSTVPSAMPASSGPMTTSGSIKSPPGSRLTQQGALLPALHIGGASSASTTTSAATPSSAPAPARAPILVLGPRSEIVTSPTTTTTMAMSSAGSPPAPAALAPRLASNASTPGASAGAVAPPAPAPAAPGGAAPTSTGAPRPRLSIKLKAPRPPPAPPGGGPSAGSPPA